MDNIEDIKKECERYRLLYENADNSLTYWETKCRRLEIENEQMKFQLDNAPLGLLDIYKQAMQEIRDMVDCANCEYESNDNCNPQQCSKIETKINEVIGE